MPSYYFHLAFELYHYSPQTSASEVSVAPASTVVANPYIPRQNLNLFSDKLPNHAAPSWTSILAPRKEFRRTRSGIDQHEHKRGSHWQGCRRSSSRSSNNDTEIAIQEKIRSSPDPHSAKGQVELPRKVRKDWRSAEVCIDSIEMELGELQTRVEARQSQRPTAPGATLPLTARYTPTNPKTTQFGWGTVHLYRDEDEIPEIGIPGQESKIDEDAAFLDTDCTTLCILAVPSYMTPSDLLGWVGEETRDLVSHFRLVRSDRSNRFMVLLKFRVGDAAKKWQRDWNGKLFNSMEPENAHIVFIKSISFQAQAVNKDPESFPNMSNDPFTPAITKPHLTTNTSAPTKPDVFNSISLVELPTCPVCLERMDETTGLATVFCQHVFHCACLQKWRGSGCPVCRYTQDDPTHKPSSSESEDSACTTCGATSNLWICLICGNVGCGRYDEAHAQEHFKQTSHAFAMDQTDQHIWDYAGDNYVHRLLQDKSNGKLVELPSAHSSSLRSSNNYVSDLDGEKIDKMSHEYTTLLSSQLDSQRLYFQEQLDRAADKAAKANAAAEAASQEVQIAIARAQELEASHHTILEETLPALEKEKGRAERRAEKADALFRQIRKDAQEKEVMNDSLLERVKWLQSQVEELTKGKSEVEETNRDLMGYISCMERLKNAGEDIEQGTVTVADAPVRKKKNRGGKKKEAGTVVQASLQES